MLGELGDFPEMERSNGDFIIRSVSCPLGAVSAVHPEVCRLGQALVAEVVGMPVRERCTRGPSPRCCFEINQPGAG
jgi:predicted ArsR family transcriptional regulator